jgi:hypothetical protein
MVKYKIYRGFLADGTEKIGCTTEYPKRCEKQSMYDYYVVEEYDDIYKASEREIELQIEVFGKRDNHTPYYISFNNRPKQGQTNKKVLSDMGKKGWVASREKYPDMGERISKSLKQSGINKGENNSAAVLTEDKVRYIRKWMPVGARGPYTQERMAKAMGCSKGHISNVIARRIWSDLKD